MGRHKHCLSSWITIQYFPSINTKKTGGFVETAVRMAQGLEYVDEFLAASALRRCAIFLYTG